MAKYEIRQGGVKDTETGASIPDAEGNRHWKEYQEWLVAGNIPDADPTDYLGIAKASRIQGFWSEATRRIDAVAAGFDADSGDVNYPVKAARNRDKNARRLSTLSRGGTLTAQEDLDHDAFDNFLDWADLTFDAADTAESVVEAAVDIPTVEAVVAVWPAFV